MELEYICPHGVKSIGPWLGSCCKCRYGERSHLEYKERPDKDSSELMNQNIGKKLVDAFEMRSEE